MRRFFKPVIFGIFSIAFSLLGGCSGSKSISSLYTQKDIKIDGNLSDWSYSDALISENDSFNYYVSNDKSNLYLYIDFKSPFYKSAAESSGFTIYFGTDPKNKRAFGITYPVGSFNFLRDMPGAYKDFLDDPEWMTKADHQKLLDSFKKDNYKKVMITRKDDPKGTPQRVIIDLAKLKAQGIDLAVNKSNRLISMEMKIPLRSSQTQQLALDPGKSSKIDLGFEIEPPDFKIQDDNTDMTSRRRYSNYGGYYGTGRTRDTGYEKKQMLTRRLGQYDKWFNIVLSKPDN